VMLQPRIQGFQKIAIAIATTREGCQFFSRKFFFHWGML
jgi:hypothetical protein